MKEAVLTFLCALAAGTLSAWGVGGGTLLLLALTLLLGVEQRQAQTLNLLFFLPAAGAALFFHSRHGELDAAAVRRTALPGALAALLGAGAAMVLLSDPIRREAEGMPAAVRTVELSSHPGFMDAYIDGMYFA